MSRRGFLSKQVVPRSVHWFSSFFFFGISPSGYLSTWTTTSLNTTQTSRPSSLRCQRWCPVSSRSPSSKYENESAACSNWRMEKNQMNPSCRFRPPVEALPSQRLCAPRELDWRSRSSFSDFRPNVKPFLHIVNTTRPSSYHFVIWI